MNGISSRLAAALFALCFTATLKAQAVQGLQVEVQTPHRSVPLDGAVSLNVALRNTRSNAALNVGRRPDWSRDGGLALFVMKPDGALEPLPAAARAPGATEPQRDLRIDAGSALSLRRTIRVADFASAPGEYRLVAEYRPARGDARSAVSAPVSIRVQAARAPN